MIVRCCSAFALCLVVAATLAAQCPDPANLVSNCGFEVDGNGWEPVKGDSLLRSTLDARTGTASLSCDAGEYVYDWRVIAETCVDVAPNTEYVSGGYVKLLAGSGVECRVYINEYNADDCVSFVYGHSTELTAIDSASWQLLQYSFSSDVNTESVLLDIDCLATTGDFSVGLDDAFCGVGIVPPLFADGFESGSTSAWSSTGF